MMEKDTKDKNSSSGVSGLVAHLLVNGLKKGFDKNQSFSTRFQVLVIAWVLPFVFFFIATLIGSSSTVGFHTIFALIGMFLLVPAGGMTIGLTFSILANILKVFTKPKEDSK